MSLDALREGVNWQFDDFSSYLDFLAKRGVYPNVASFCSNWRECCRCSMLP